MSVVTRTNKFTSAPLVVRFWEKVTKTAACWNWTGSVNSSGYGQIWAHGRKAIASRVSWELHYGEPPAPELFVCHTCDNPLCVRPAHLFLGTQQDNMRDAASKGRLAVQARPEQRVRGSRHGQSKLTEAEVRDFRARVQRGEETANSLARKRGMSESAVRSAIEGRTWAWVK